MKVTFQIETSNKKEIANISAFLQGLTDPKGKAVSTLEPVQPDTDRSMVVFEPDQEPEVSTPVQESVVPPVQEVQQPDPVAETVQPPTSQPVDAEELREEAKVLARTLITNGNHIAVGAVMKKYKVASVTKAPADIIPEIYADLKAVQ